MNPSTTGNTLREDLDEIITCVGHSSEGVFGGVNDSDAIDAILDTIIQALPKFMKHPLYGADVRTFSQEDRDKWYRGQGREDALTSVTSLLEEAKKAISQAVIEARIDELKKAWNATQPDIVPGGWKPETDEAIYIAKRLVELKEELK